MFLNFLILHYSGQTLRGMWELCFCCCFLSLCVCLWRKKLHNEHLASILSIYIHIPSLLCQQHHSSILRTVFRFSFLPAGLLFLVMYITLMYLLTSPLAPRKAISLMQESGVLAIIASRVGHHKEIRFFYTHLQVHMCRIDVHVFVKVLFVVCVSHKGDFSLLVCMVMCAVHPDRL